MTVHTCEWKPRAGGGRVCKIQGCLPGRGRPPSGSTSMEHRVTVRLTVEERAKLERYRERHSESTVVAALRRLIRRCKT